MRAKIHIVFDGDRSQPEIRLSATAADFCQLGAWLSSIDLPSRWETEPCVSEFYPESLVALVAEPTRDSDELLLIELVDDALRISGGASRLADLGESLLNFFGDGAEAGSHFHLDYFEGSGDLRATNCHLIFVGE